MARDQALAADRQAEGQILSDQATLDNANINLGYTDIRAPISGKISKSNITVGNVVGPSSGILTVIVSQDPMYVTFPVSQREFLNFQASGKQVNRKDIEVRIRFANGVTYNQVGTISFVDRDPSALCDVSGTPGKTQGIGSTLGNVQAGRMNPGLSTLPIECETLSVAALAENG